MSKNQRTLLFLAVGLLLGGGVAYWRLVSKPRDQANYEALWDAPKGWNKADQGVLAIFRYKHPGKELYLRGSLNQWVPSDVPRMDTDTMAQYQLETTQENQEDWTAKRLEDVKTPTLRFAVIRREQKDQAVVNAFVVKGNTALIVSLTASGKEAGELVDQGMPEFKKLLESIRMKPTVVE